MLSGKFANASNHIHNTTEQYQQWMAVPALCIYIRKQLLTERVERFVFNYRRWERLVSLRSILYASICYAGSARHSYMVVQCECVQDEIGAISRKVFYWLRSYQIQSFWIAASIVTGYKWRPVDEIEIILCYRTKMKTEWHILEDVVFGILYDYIQDGTGQKSNRPHHE